MPEIKSPTRRVCFGVFEVDLHTRELRKDGVKQQFSGQPFQVLAILLEHAGDVVTREELQKRLWSDTFVDAERNLNTAVNKIREALGDSAESPRFVETLPRRGYRFIGELDVPIQPAISAVTDEPYRGRFRSEIWWKIGKSIFATLVIVLVAFVAYRWQRQKLRPRVKVQISMPEGESGRFELSPDGRFLGLTNCDAFTCKIWLRPLDSLEVQSIGEGLRPLFWSPDSKYFVYSSANKLYKMPPNGAPPVLLADAPQRYVGGAWLDDGTIVIAARTGLYSVPDSGGTLRKLSDQDILNISWLPGGRFLISNGDGLFVASLRGEKPVLILPDNIPVVYVPSANSELRGHLLFARQGALLAQEFDADKLQLHGDPIHIVASGSDPGGVFVNSVAASRNGVLAFRSGNVSRVALSWLDRSGNKLQTVSPPFDLPSNSTIRLSPDDSKAIVQAGTTFVDLWIADLARGTLSRFTFDGAVGGLWSPDGHKILWADRNFHHFLKAADGSGNSELLYKNPGCPACLIYDWSEEGNLISFATMNEGQASILLVPLDSDRKPFLFRKVAFNDFYGMFSPDHRWLAYVSDESGENQIYIESIPAGKRRWQVSTQGGNWPIWRRDGKELFYRQGGTIVSVPIHLTETDVEIGKPQSLFTVPPFTRFQVSRDGQRFLIALPVEGTSSSSSITIDTDWQAVLGWHN